jgi:hypothetical protein
VSCRLCFGMCFIEADQSGRFYDGGGRERDILTRAYLRLIKHVNSIYKASIV